MIGTFYSITGEALNQPPIELHKNFYRAIVEAQGLINGEIISMSADSQWCLVGNSDITPKRIMVSSE